MPTVNNSWKRWISADWSGRLTAFLVGLFLLQYVNWIVEEEVIWLGMTVWLVKWTLLLVGMTFLIPRISWLARFLLQLALVILVQIRLFELHFTAIPIRPLSAFQQSVHNNFSQFEPYIWFSLSAWLVYNAAMWLVQAKLRIYLMILISVLFFAVRDSFTTIVLWEQVAVLLFCGLSLLVIRHFSELKQRAPKSWEKLTQYPAAIGVPVMLLIVATIVVAALAPSMKPILTDPYTAWKVSKGEPFTLSGKGVPVSIPSMDASSGYSRDDSQLGGSFQFDYSLVMSVTTDSKTYMRGETRSLYNGSGWEPSETEKRLPLRGVSNTNLPQDPRFDISKLKTKEVKQTVEMSNQERYPVLFGGFAIQRLEELNKGETGFESLRWSPRQSELRYAARRNYPKQYTIVSQQPEYNEDDLRQTAGSYVGDAQWDEYLQLPRDLPARVKQLALNLTQEAANPYDKAKKIEQYLSQTIPYTNEPDVKKGSSKDFVDRFLFEIKEGYCDYYSTAMVVMTRSIGIPARWVKGYTSGQTQVAPQLENLGVLRAPITMDTDGAGTYTIRNSDAHSWVEVYFEGFGWIPFEPTAGFTMPKITPTVESTPTTPTASAAPVVKEPAAPSDQASPFLLWTIVTSGVLAVILLGVYLLIKFGWLTEWKERVKKKQAVSFSQRIVMEFERLLRYGSRKGYKRQEHETIREAVNRWTLQSSGLKPNLETVLDHFEKAKYSQRAASEQDFISVNQAIEKLRAQMK
jgi:transglutaminase-like putative cysteine protease